MGGGTSADHVLPFYHFPVRGCLINQRDPIHRSWSLMAIISRLTLEVSCSFANVSCLSFKPIVLAHFELNKSLKPVVRAFHTSQCRNGSGRCEIFGDVPGCISHVTITATESWAQPEFRFGTCRPVHIPIHRRIHISRIREHGMDLTWPTAPFE